MQLYFGNKLIWYKNLLIPFSQKNLLSLSLSPFLISQEMTDFGTREKMYSLSCLVSLFWGVFVHVFIFDRYSSSGKKRVPIKQDVRKRDDAQHNSWVPVLVRAFGMSKLQLVRNRTLLFRKTTENMYVSPNLRQIQQTLLFVLKERVSPYCTIHLKV